MAQKNPPASPKKANTASSAKPAAKAKAKSSPTKEAPPKQEKKPVAASPKKGVTASAKKPPAPKQKEKAKELEAPLPKPKEALALSKPLGATAPSQKPTEAIKKPTEALVSAKATETVVAPKSKNDLPPVAKPPKMAPSLDAAPSPKAPIAPKAKDINTENKTEPHAESDSLPMNVTFPSLIDDLLLLSCVEKAGFEFPTAVQAKALPLTLRGKDVCAFAQTGTGKTAVISITGGQKLLENAEKRGEPKKPLILVLVPTRELAVQVELDIQKLLEPLEAKTVAVFGGADMDKQIQALQKGVDAVVATPGRLLDLYKNKHLDLDRIGLFVCDEADRMFDMGFIEDVEYFLKQIPPEGVQKLFTSATGSEKVRELAFEYLDDPEYLEANPETITPEKIKQGVFAVPAIEKFQVLLGHIVTEKPTCAIVFTNTKVVAEWVGYKLACNGISAEALTGDLPQAKRMGLIKQIKDGKLQVLVATDVLSRGLHVVGLSHVYNFDIPEESESFVHRIGRTARAGAEGTAISFVCEDYGFHMGGVETLLGFPIPVWTPPASYYAIEDKSDFPFDDFGRIKSYPFAPSSPQGVRGKEELADFGQTETDRPRHKDFSKDKPFDRKHEKKDQQEGRISQQVHPESGRPANPNVIGATASPIVRAPSIASPMAPLASASMGAEMGAGSFTQSESASAILPRIIPKSAQVPAAPVSPASAVQPVSQMQMPIQKAQRPEAEPAATLNQSISRELPRTELDKAAVEKPFAQRPQGDRKDRAFSPEKPAGERPSFTPTPKPLPSGQAIPSQVASTRPQPGAQASSDFVQSKGKPGFNQDSVQGQQHRKEDRFRDEKAREAVEEALSAARAAADKRRALAAQPPRGSAEEALLSAGEFVGETLGFFRGKVEAITQRGVPLISELVERFRAGFQKQVEKQRDRL